MPITDKFKRESTVRDWIIEIIANLHQLEKGSIFSTFTFAPSSLKEEAGDSVLSRFLSLLREGRLKFAQGKLLIILRYQ
jgi:hypothetical protein